MNLLTRAVAVTASAALLVLGSGGVASADEIVVEVGGQQVVVDSSVADDVKIADTGGAEKAVRQVLGEDGGAPPRAFSPVVGYIEIVANGPGAPLVTLHGDLANPLNWSCSTAAQYNPLLPFKVTCSPQTANLVFDCQVLHADIQTLSAGAVGRTTMDCNNDNVAEAQTQTVTGATGYDFQWAVQSTLVTQFVCIVDNGVNLGPTPNYRAGCGDPGVPHL